jgi:hypothetical protein
MQTLNAGNLHQHGRVTPTVVRRGWNWVLASHNRRRPLIPIASGINP